MSAKDEAGADPLAALKIDLDQLDEDHHEVDTALPSAWIAEILAETDAHVPNDGRATLTIDVQADRTVLVRGGLALRYTVPCARCLDPAPVDAGAEAGELCLTYVPSDRLRRWAEVSGEGEGDDDEIEPLEPGELDEIGYDGKILDLTGLAREQILLAYPMRALCARGEACLGLCSSCGANLNTEDRVSPERCPACGQRLDGSDDEGEDTPWKRALAKLESKD